MKKLLNKKVVQNSAWLFVLQFANTVLPLLTIPYVTRVLGATGYGQFSVAYNWITYCQVIVEYGFTLNGARKIAINADNRDDEKLWGRIVCSRAVLFIFSFVAMNWICFFAEDLTRYKNTMILMLIVFSVIFQMNWLYQGKQQMKFITIINVAGRVLSVLLIFLLVKNPDHVTLYCFLYAFTFLFSSFTGLIVALYKYKIRPNIAKPVEVVAELKEGWPLFTSSAVSRLFGSVGITILGIFTAESVVGTYSAVYKIPYLLNLCFAPISQALFPYISKKYAEDFQSALKLQKKIMSVVIGAFAIISLVIILLRKWIVPFLFGAEYTGYSNLVLILAPQLLLGIVNNFLGVQTLVAVGLQKNYSHCIITNIIVLLISSFVLCPGLGAYGIAASALLSEAILTVMLFINCKEKVWRKQSLS